MRRPRLLIPGQRKPAGAEEWEGRPARYHCISRICQRQFLLGMAEKEKFRSFMRMYEGFSGCRVLAYCLMDNHIHLLVEVPMMPEGGLSDAELLQRLGCIYHGGIVAEEAQRLAKARAEGNDAWAADIHAQYTHRMHDLSRFMRDLMGRFSQWYNHSNNRKGILWEARFKSVLVEDGAASRAIAAYIDLNPVRAGMVADPADYRWSSYGEAMGGGAKGNGKKARAGLVRAIGAPQGLAADAALWAGDLSKAYRLLLLGAGQEKVREVMDAAGQPTTEVVRKGMEQAAAKSEMAELEQARDVALAKVVRCRVRYFTDGLIIGSKGFVNEVFAACRNRFGAGRKDGARRMRGAAQAVNRDLWSARDLRKGIG